MKTSKSMCPNFEEEIETITRYCKCCNEKTNHDPVKPGVGLITFECQECASKVTLNAYTGAFMFNGSC